jgi:type I restriction enzyme, R subunit
LRQGIEDGFLAPYRVHRIVSEWDAAGWRPSSADLDRYGRPIPDDEYQTKDFERVVALRARTETIARHLTEFLKKSDRFAKTIIFCVDQEHASEMRGALTRLNPDFMAQFPDYVCRVTSEEGDIGRGHLSRFQDVDTKTPAILTTSQLLTTGVDAPTCKNIVIARVIGSMSEFKLIIGRGTRVREDYGKFWFNILDYTGSATRLFADPAFDGEPIRITEEEIQDDGRVRIISESDSEERMEESGQGPVIHEPPDSERRKFYFDGGQVEIAAHLVYELDPNGKQLRVVRYTDYAAETVRTLAASLRELRERWSDADQRSEVIKALNERVSLSTHSPKRRNSPTPILLTFCVTWLLTHRSERAVSAPS